MINLNDECPVCLEIVENPLLPYNCTHQYHEECFNNLLKAKHNKCILCMSSKQFKNTQQDSLELDNINYIFDNHSDNRNFNLKYYLNLWPKKRCLSEHCFHIETLGDWGWPDRSRDIEFSFRNMLIECKDCKQSVVI